MFPLILFQNFPHTSILIAIPIPIPTPTPVALRLLALDSLDMDQVLDIDLGTLETVPCIDRAPQQREKHDATVDETRIVHVQVVEVLALDCGEAKHGDDECDPGDGNGADGLGEAAQVPGSCLQGRVSNTREKPNKLHCFLFPP